MRRRWARPVLEELHQVFHVCLLFILTVTELIDNIEEVQDPVKQRSLPFPPRS